MKDDLLFQSFDLNGLKLKNRVVMAPMTRSRAVENNSPNELMVQYYRQRAGAGLIITEGVAPSPNGLGYPRIPGVFNDEQVKGWKAITDAVHEKDAKIFMQLMHVGRVGHVNNLPQGAMLVAPSDAVLPGEMYTDQEGPQLHSKPRAMSKEDIKTAISEFTHAAINAIKAGFDGVEIHGANGYLIEQFISPHTNTRTDEYGGSVENRGRFLLEVAESIAKHIGNEKTGIRLSPYGVFNDMPHYESIDETYTYIARELKNIGLVYVHLVDHAAQGAPEVPESLKLTIKKEFGGTLIISGGYDKQRAEADLQRGLGELVAFGRPFISNPDFVKRMKIDAPLSEPDYDKLYTPGEEGYTDYPVLEKESVV